VSGELNAGPRSAKNDGPDRLVLKATYGLTVLSMTRSST